MKKIELNCSDYNPESTEMSAVKFYFAGTKKFQMCSDDRVYLGPFTPKLTEKARRWTEIEPRRALGWLNESDSVERICLKYGIGEDFDYSIGERHDWNWSSVVHRFFGSY